MYFEINSITYDMQHTLRNSSRISLRTEVIFSQLFCARLCMHDQLEMVANKSQFMHRNFCCTLLATIFWYGNSSRTIFCIHLLCTKYFSLDNFYPYLLISKIFIYIEKNRSIKISEYIVNEMRAIANMKKFQI